MRKNQRTVSGSHNIARYIEEVIGVDPIDVVICKEAFSCCGYFKNVAGFVIFDWNIQKWKSWRLNELARFYKAPEHRREEFKLVARTIRKMKSPTMVFGKERIEVEDLWREVGHVQTAYNLPDNYNAEYAAHMWALKRAKKR